MIRTSKMLTALGILAFACTWTISAARANDPAGFKTPRPAQLVPLAGGVKIEPIISTGDVVGGALAGYQFSGIPDGIGAFGAATAPGRSS